MHTILCLLFLLCVKASTNVCDVKNQDIDEEVRGVFEARILCEGSEFKGPACSSYWMREQRLLRTKFQLRQCDELQAEPYLLFAGTSSTPGIFFYEQVNTSTLSNKTSDDLRSAMTDEYVALSNNVGTLWSNVRGYFSNLISTQWEGTRNNGSAEEQTTRSKVYTDYGLATRTKAFESATTDRSEVTTQNQATRTFDSNTESDTRALILAQHDQTRTHDHNEEDSTRSLVDKNGDNLRQFWSETSNAMQIATVSTLTSDSAAFRSNNNKEESATRALVSSTSTATQSVVAKEENATTVTVSSSHSNQTTVTTNAALDDSIQTQKAVPVAAQQEREEMISSQATVKTTWSSLVSTVSAVTSLWSTVLDNQQAELIRIFTHIDLQSDTWNINEQDTLMNQFSPVDYFQRNTYIDQLRFVCNETLATNKLLYGRDDTAYSTFATADNYKNNGDYRRAAKYYRLAYKRAVVPQGGIFFNI